jgi:hypothetical protein
MFSDFPLLRYNAIPKGRLCREKCFEGMPKCAAERFDFHMTLTAGHWPQRARYPEFDYHRRLLFRRAARVPLRLATTTFFFFGAARLRLSVGVRVGVPASSATNAVATQTICGSPLTNSFQEWPALMEPHSFPLRVPK